MSNIDFNIKDLKTYSWLLAFIFTDQVCFVIFGLWLLAKDIIAMNTKQFEKQLVSIISATVYWIGGKNYV